MAVNAAREMIKTTTRKEKWKGIKLFSLDEIIGFYL
jgi:hypothetical protein